MATIYPIGSTADGGVRYSDGSIKYQSQAATPYQQPIGSGTGGNPIYQTSNQSSGSVLGATTTAPTTQQQQTTQQSSINLKDRNANPGSGYFWDSADGWKPATPEVPQGPSEADLNALYQPAYDYLNQYQTSLQGQLPGVIQGAQDQYNTYLATLDANKQQAYGNLDLGKSKAETRKQQADAASRQLYNELQMGNQQRFGGSSSAGEAAQALQGRELQRSMGANTQQLGSFLQEYQTNKQNIESGYNAGKLQLEQQKNDAVNKANQDYQSKLLEISKTKAGLAQEKAAKSIEALQNYRNQIFQIQMQNAQFQQALDAQRQASDLQLQNSLAQFKATQGSGNASLNSLLSSGLNVNPQTGFNVGQQGGQQANPYVGSISSNKDQMALTGQIYPIKNYLDGRVGYSDGSIR